MNELWSQWFVPVAVGAAAAGILTLIRLVVFRLLGRWARKTETKLDDIVLQEFRRPSIFWCIAVGLDVGLTVSELPGRYMGVANKALWAAIILSVSLTLASLAVRLLKSSIEEARIPIAASGLVFGVLRWGIILIGIVVILGALGVSVAPILTALGVGGLAVALAMQDTLANLFAGIHILMEKSVRVGDFVRLESGQEGYVDDISWRTTRVRLLSNNMVIIPNAKLSQSVLTNYYLPEKRMSLLIPVGVSYDCDPAKVEAVLLEVAKEAAGKLPGLLAEPAPFVRFNPGFGASSLDFTLICQVAEFTDQYAVQHELRKRIFARFRVEGIEIPFPQRVVHMRAEKEK
jgi:small-conductance mechanosensitive channel